MNNELSLPWPEMHKHLKQLFKFGIVGGLSTLLNSAAFIFFVDVLSITPLVGNLMAFCLAFWVSYWGQSKWTFEHRNHTKEKLFKFFLVCLLGLGMNTFFVWLLMHVFSKSAYVAILPMIFITPLVVFFINKFWVFNESNGG